jgi:hypothetical protein
LHLYTLPFNSNALRPEEKQIARAPILLLSSSYPAAAAIMKLELSTI